MPRVIRAALLAAACLPWRRLRSAKKEVAPVGTTVIAEVSRSDAWTGVASAADRNRINRTALAWQAGLGRGAAPAAFARRSAAKAACSSVAAAWRAPRRPRGRTAAGSSRSADRPSAARRSRSSSPSSATSTSRVSCSRSSSRPAASGPPGACGPTQIPTRLIFLGSLALGNEEEARAYGDDPRRDVAGVFERIAPFVWRLVIPFPQDGTKVQVFELTPVAEQPKG